MADSDWPSALEKGIRPSAHGRNPKRIRVRSSRLCRIVSSQLTNRKRNAYSSQIGAKIAALVKRRGKAQDLSRNESITGCLYSICVAWVTAMLTARTSGIIHRKTSEPTNKSLGIRPDHIPSRLGVSRVRKHVQNADRTHPRTREKETANMNQGDSGSNVLRSPWISWTWASCAKALVLTS